ncbi:MAG: hypothetical protein JOZ64_12455 [Solirubrobacterales bacterium]|nr:hypothetical protein [Solirubrobacterales bacterium]
MTRFSTLIVLAVLLAALGCSSVAGAAGTPNPVSDCNAHGMLTRTYTDAELRHGLSTMPADIKEYTNCYDVLQRQLLAQLGKSQSSAGSDTSSSSGGSFLPTPVIVVLVVLVLAAVTFGAIALRRRASAGGGGEGAS